MGVRYRGQAVFKLGLVQPARQIKFASDKGSQITTDHNTQSGKRRCYYSSKAMIGDDWVLQFDLAYNDVGQRKNGPFSARIATTGKWLDGIMFSDKLEAVMWLELTSTWEYNLAESCTRKKSCYNKLESEYRSKRSKGWSVIPLYVEIAAPTEYQHSVGDDKQINGLRLPLLRYCLGQDLPEDQHTCHRHEY